MSLLKVIVLAIVQGLAELLPVSSSAHVVVTEKLLGLGVEGLVTEAGADIERIRLAGEARRLLMPEEMGEAFKMMALGRDLDIPLAGFALQDLRHLL